MNVNSYLQVATLAITFLTGVAVAVFAGLTYRLSSNISRRRYSPIVEIYSVGAPEVGSFEHSGLRFEGVKWRLSIINSGDVLVLVDSMSISILTKRLGDSEQHVWTGISKLCELYEEDGNIPTERAIEVNGNRQRRITVFWCRDSEVPAQHRLFMPGDSTQMQFEALQRGMPPKPEGWLLERSESFRVPDKFGKERISLRGLVQYNG